MPRSTPILSAFNSGAFSELMQGRVDFARMRTSLRRSSNFIPVVQGPLIRRPGTRMITPVYDEARKSTLVPFEYAETGHLQLEFAHQRIRVFTENGLLVRASTVVTAAADAGGFVRVTAAGHGATVGEQVALAGFDDETSLNGLVGNVTAVAGDNVTTDIVFPSGGISSVATATVARVFEIASPYDEADLPNIRYVQRNSLMRLYCKGKRNYKLTRVSTYTWSIDEVVYIDGPYKDRNATVEKMTLSGTGQSVPAMTGATAPSGTASASGSDTGREPFKAFDRDGDTFWRADTQQFGWLQYQFPSAKVIDGFSIHLPLDNNQSAYASTDYGPKEFQLLGSNDGTNFDVLHSEVNYQLWDNNRSAYFTLQNDTAYAYYRLDIKRLVQNGEINPAIKQLVLTGPADRALTLTLSDASAVNNGDGFASTDVGRLVRLRGDDTYWRPLRITSYTSSTEVGVDLEGDPFDQIPDTTYWRMGLYSDTTGWPTVGFIYERRLWLAGQIEDPDLVVGSFSDRPDAMPPSDPDGVVTAEHAIVVPLDAPSLPVVHWINADERGLIVGTNGGAYILVAIDTSEAIGPTNARWRPSAARKADAVAPVKIDRQVLYVTRGLKGLRELAYSLQADGFKSPSMTVYADDLAGRKLLQMAYAEEPHSIVWCRAGDGSLLGFTYNRDDDVLGWHAHDLGGEVEAVSSSYRSDVSEDALWVIVKRTIDGVTRRYVERIEAMWNDEMTIYDAWFLDSALEYSGAATDMIYGLRHLAGESVYALADGAPQGPFDVTADGAITLTNEAEHVVVGKGMKSWALMARIEAASPDGTAQGKLKSFGEMVMRLWKSAGGVIALEDNLDARQPLINRDTTISLNAPVDLVNGDYDLSHPFERDRAGSLYIEQPEDQPLPFNIVAIMPNTETTNL
jgi:hypothetical protein